MDFQLNLESETVAEVSTPNPPCVDVTSSLRETLGVMKEKQRAAVFVCDGEKLAGIFTERDALKYLLPGAELDVPMSAVMTANPQALSANDTVGSAISKMSRGGYRRMPIIDTDGRPQGFVKVRSIITYLVEHVPAVVHNLPPDPHHSTQTREGA